MEGQELLDYVKEVKDLEAAVYANEQMCRGFQEKAELEEPDFPELTGLESETKPSEVASFIVDADKAHLKSLKKDYAGYLVILIFGILLFIIPIVTSIAVLGYFDFDFLAFMFFLGGISVIITGALLLHSTKQQIASKEQKIASAAAQDKKFEAEIDQIIEHNNEKKSAYNAAMAEYTKKKDKYDALCGSQLSLLTDAGTALRTARDTLYQMDVIYPKYRNIVAVSSIYEYLASGRCSRLDGPDGAYNLYEMELRQNIVIGQLSAISGNLEQIKNNQYTLYQDLLTANHQSFEMLSDISDSAKYSAYSSEATAKNTEALKFMAYWDHANRRH